MPFPSPSESSPLAHMLHHTRPQRRCTLLCPQYISYEDRRVNCSSGFTREPSRKASLTCHCFISSLTPLESSRSLSLWVASCRTLAVVSASVSQARNLSRSRGNCCSNLWVSSRAASRSLTLQRNKYPDAALLRYHNGAPSPPPTRP